MNSKNHHIPKGGNSKAVKEVNLLDFGDGDNDDEEDSKSDSIGTKFKQMYKINRAQTFFKEL